MTQRRCLHCGAPSGDRPFCSKDFALIPNDVKARMRRLQNMGSPKLAVKIGIDALKDLNAVAAPAGGGLRMERGGA